MITRISVLLCCFAASFTSSVYSQVDLAVNGSFEVGPPIPGQQTELTVEGSAIPGWFVPLGNGGVDYNSSFWTPSQGVRSIDLNGANPASIEQTLTTSIGMRLRVLFDLGATGAGSRAMQISAAGSNSPAFSHTGPGFPIVSYARDRSWEFIATTTSTTIRFESLEQGGNGPHIDNVRIYALEPLASFTTFGAGCAGSAGLPALHAQGGSLPRLNSTFQMALTTLPAGPLNATFGMMGISNATWAGIALPLSLDGVGASGCQLLVSPDSTFALANLGGGATWAITVPNDGLIAGAQAFAQGLVFDLAANELGVLLSNGGVMTVGY